VEGLSYRIEHALRLTTEARRKALAVMAERVRTHDVYRWVSGQLAEIAAREGRSVVAAHRLPSPHPQ
jgi:trehalose-6-phosphate synthase